jgi:hypothetical protein
MRLLCDVSKEGQDAIAEFFGLPPTVVLKESWNTGTGNPTGESVGSVLLPRSLFTDLAAFCLLANGARVAVQTVRGDVIGVYPTDYAEFRERDEDPVEQIRHFYGVSRTYGQPGSQPHVGFSNVHQFTGRTA